MTWAGDTTTVYHRRLESCDISHLPRIHEAKGNKTYNTRDSPVVTHPSTNLAIIGLSMGERTGSRVLRCLWSYVTVTAKASVIWDSSNFSAVEVP
jgi:hypothetical protein